MQSKELPGGSQEGKRQNKKTQVANLWDQT